MEPMDKELAEKFLIICKKCHSSTDVDISVDASIYDDSYSVACEVKCEKCGQTHRPIRRSRSVTRATLESA